MVEIATDGPPHLQKVDITTSLMFWSEFNEVLMTFVKFWKHTWYLKYIDVWIWRNRFEDGRVENKEIKATSWVEGTSRSRKVNQGLKVLPLCLKSPCPYHNPSDFWWILFRTIKHLAPTYLPMFINYKRTKLLPFCQIYDIRCKWCWCWCWWSPIDD